MASTSPLPVAANGSCAPNGSPGANGGSAGQGRNNNGVDFPNSSFSGWYTNRGGLGAVSANISLENPYIYSTAGNGDEDAVWVMLSNQNSYAQVGYLVYPDHYTAFVEQATYGQTNFSVQMGTDGMAMGSTYSFMVTYDGQHTFNFYLGGNWVYGSYATFVPTQAQNEAESHTIASAMPGTTHDGGEQFTNEQVWTGTPGTGNGGWSSFNGTLSEFNGSYNGVGAGQYWGEGSTSDHHWSWDWACY